MTALPVADLELVRVALGTHWQSLGGKKLFVTGGTGFFGAWLIESLLRAVDHDRVDVHATILTRDARAFAERSPYVADHPAIELLEGDVRSFEFPRGEFAFVIHAATDASAQLNESRPAEMFDTIVDGTRHVLDFAQRAGTQRLLLTSSGLVYGKQVVESVREDDATAPLPTDARSAYGEGKRVAELLCAMTPGVECLIARCFAFVGPRLPLDRHFAIGNFIADALAGRAIEIRGDGTPLRTYLYAADLAVWLWTILFRGVPMRPYNVGSETALSIREVAERVANGVVPVQVAGTPDPARPPERYVPSTERARRELGLRETVDLDDAIARTMAWHRAM
jgi:dTDP-glucose 4,6-dehydratase